MGPHANPASVQPVIWQVFIFVKCSVPSVEEILTPSYCIFSHSSVEFTGTLHVTPFPSIAKTQVSSIQEINIVRGLELSGGTVDIKFTLLRFVGHSLAPVCTKYQIFVILYTNSNAFSSLGVLSTDLIRICGIQTCACQT